METNIRNKCKAYTSLEQSKKLAEILPLESYDMYWDLFDTAGRSYTPHLGRSISIDRNFLSFQEGGVVPAWSLAALLGVLPNKLQIALAINDFQGDRKEKYAIGSVEHDRYDCYADNPIDACYELILKLHGINLL